MQLYILLICSVICSAVYSTLNSAFATKTMHGNADFYLYNCIMSFTSAIIFFIMSGMLSQISLYTALMGGLFALVSMGSQYTMLSSMKYGPMSYTVMMLSCGMILPSVAGVIFWKESFSYLQLIGMVIIICCFLTGANFKKHKNISLKWLVMASFLFICSGVIGIIQKIHQSSVHKGELYSLLFVNFFLMGIASVVFFLREKRTDKSCNTFKLDLSNLACCIGIGIFFSFVNAVNLYLSGRLPSMFFFPTVNGGNTVLCGIVSYFLLKEKLDRSQIISFAAGVIGLICLGLG